VKRRNSNFRVLYETCLTLKDPIPEVCFSDNPDKRHCRIALGRGWYNFIVNLFLTCFLISYEMVSRLLFRLSGYCR
jgi:hypothetical protein